MWLHLSNKMWVEVSRNVCHLQTAALNWDCSNHQLPLFSHGNWERQCIQRVDQGPNHGVTVWKSIIPKMYPNANFLFGIMFCIRGKNILLCWGSDMLRLLPASVRILPEQQNQREKIYDRTWLMPWRRPRTLMICHLQTGEPGKLVV